MTTSLPGTESVLIGIAALVFFIIRQFQTRTIASPWAVLLPVGLAYFGAQSLGQLDATGWAVLGLNLSLGVALGFARATTLRVWLDEQGRALARSTGLTFALWLATFAARLLIELAEYKTGLTAGSMSAAQTLLPIAATLAAQNLVVYLRSRDARLDSLTCG